MNRYLLIASLFFFACNSPSKKEEVTQAAPEETQQHSGIKIDVYDYKGLEPLINVEDDNIHIVNFWATWCAPCVKELPYFEKINSEYADNGVDVLLVSLDFPKQYDSKLKPFLKKYDLKSKVVALDDVDQNTWIPAINEDWSGALPATIIYKGDKRKFYEGSFTYEELEHELKQFLK